LSLGLSLPNCSVYINPLPCQVHLRFCSKVIHILYTQQSLPTPREEFNRALRQLPHSFERQQTHRATPCFIQFRDNLFLRLRLCLGTEFVSFTLRPSPLPKHRPARWLEDRGSRLLSSLQNFSLRQLLSGLNILRTFF